MKAPSRRINEGLNLDELPNDESQNSGSEQQNSQEATQKDAVTTNSSYLNYKDEQGSDAEKYNVTTLANYPFAASIQRRAAHYATGALIDKNWILSCAGEFFHVRESIRLFRVRLGSVDCKQGGIIIPLTRVEIHPSYVYGEPNFDVSLLRLAHPVEFTEYIHPINLSTVRTKVISAKFMTIYWPRVIIKGKILPATAEERIKQRSMRDSTQRLIPRSQCLVKLYDANTTLHDSTLCLKSFVLYHTPCLHDAGAPVVAEDGLWGITSDWTPKDCLNQTDQSPTVFTRVSSLAVKGWLDSILNVSSDS
ncbi:trypsin domain-containing protein [Phthorimaea operculella]|nr:trypsin domain-containing protein [Phthorimaea operculella]